MENEDSTELIQSDWLEIQSASSSSSSSSTNEARWFQNEDSVVIIKESFFGTDPAVFPPDNHEDLPIDSLNQKGPVEENPQMPLSPPSDDENGRRNGLAGVLSSAVDKIAFWMTWTQGYVLRAGLWRFASAATGVGALALAVVLYRRAKRLRRRTVQPESNHQLMLLIKSKDQKINELLLQVSHLNDMLLARRRVPVLQAA